MANPLVARAYDIKVTSFDDSLKNMQALTKAMTDMDAAKTKLNGKLKEKIVLGDSSIVENLQKQIKDLDDKITKLNATKEKSAKETKLLADAEKAQSDASLKSAQAEKVRNQILNDQKKIQNDATLKEAQANRIKTQSIIDQDKEIDRQIDRISKQERASKSLAETMAAEAGSYRNILALMKELGPFVRGTLPTSTATTNFQGQIIGITEAVQKFKELSATEQDFRRQFAKDGLLVAEYSSGIVKAFKDLGVTDIFKRQKDDINNNLKELKKQNQELATQYKNLSSTGGEAFDKISTELKQNIELQAKMEQSLHNVDNALNQTKSIGSHITDGISKSFKDLKTQITQFAVGYVGFQAAISGAQNLLHQNYELSDSISQLQIYLKGSKKDAEDLVNTLKGIDTRTSLTGLVDIGTIVAKKGVAKEEIAGVTKALDSLFVVLGKEAGDPHESTSSIVKLITIFSEDKHVTAERVGEIGTAIQKLTSSGVATGPFLIDFAERVGSVRGITGLTLPNILGMGAALQQLGQRSESAGTAAIQLTTKMLANVPKFAAAAGVTVEKFRALIKENPFDALVVLATKLRNGGKDFEEVTTSFAEVGITGARIKAVLGDIATNGAYVSEKMKTATVSTNDYANMAAAAGNKQGNFAASVDKIGKSFVVAFTNPAITQGLETISKVLLGLVSVITAIPFGVVIGGLGLLTAAWAFYKGNAIAATLAQSANNEATLLGSIRLGIMRSGLAGTAAQQESYAIRTAAATSAVNAQVIALNAQIISEKSSLAALEAQMIAEGTQTTILETELVARRAHIVALEGEVVATESATVATEGLNIATKASPLGIILTILALLIPALSAYAGSTTEASKSTRSLNDNLTIEGQVQASIREQTAKTKDSVKELVDIIKTQVTNEDLRKKAYEELIKISPSFIGTLDAQYNATDKLNKVYDTYISQLDKVARAQAIKNVKQKFENDKAEAEGKEFQAKIDADNESRLNTQINSENKKKALKVAGTIDVGGAVFNTNRLQSQLTEKSEAYKKAQSDANKARDAQKSFQAYMKTLSDEDRKSLIDTSIPTSTENKPGGTQTIDELKSQLETIKGEIAAIDAVKNKTVEQLSELKKLRKQKNDITREIHELGGSTKEPKTPAYRGPRQFKGIEATRNELLASAGQFYAEEKLNEVDYLNDVLQINKNAIDAKLNKLIKPANAAERIEVANLHKERIDLEVANNKKLFDLYSKDAENLLAIQTRRSQGSLDKVLDNQDSSFTDKSEARKQFNFSQLDAQRAFNNTMKSLEITYNQMSEGNEIKRADAIGKVLKDIRAQRIAAADAELSDIQRKGDEELAKFKVVMAEQERGILKGKGSASDKSEAVKELGEQTNIGTLSREIKSLQDQLPIYKQNLSAKHITEKEYADFYAGYVEKINQLNDALAGSVDKVSTVQELATQRLAKLFKFGKGSDNEKLLGETIAQSFDLATTAMGNYFDSEKNNIENSKQISLQRIDIEKQQALNHAQSQAERDTIERQSEDKKKVIEKDAVERNKKLQKAQAQINLAAQLSAIGVAAAQNPLNGLTFGVAGAIMYGLQAAIALAAYANNIKAINSVKAFAGGGKITASPNIPTQPNGDNILATVKVGEVILNENQQRRIGGASVLRRIGVPGFADGGLIQPIGGTSLMGSSLVAPRNASSFMKTGSSDDIKNLMVMVENVTVSVNNITSHVKTLKVQVVASEVQATNEKIKKANSIGTL
jgi:hypothetical protein